MKPAALIEPAALDPVVVGLDRRPGPPVRRVGVTAVQAGEGVTTLSGQLARTYARRGYATVLIEANWQAPRLAAEHGLVGQAGFADIVAGDVAPMKGVHAVADNLAIVPAGRSEAIRRVGLDDLRVVDFLGLVDARYDLAILDCPPVSQIGDTAALAPVLDGFIVVVGAERTRRVVAERAVSDLEAAGGEVLGVVLNRCRRPIPRWIYRWLG
ncbi:CpsD/CapB family tyrosine-protein kinase [Methylobacterium sp. A54F]